MAQTPQRTGDCAGCGPWTRCILDLESVCVYGPPTSSPLHKFFLQYLVQRRKWKRAADNADVSRAAVKRIPCGCQTRSTEGTTRQGKQGKVLSCLNRSPGLQSGLAFTQNHRLGCLLGMAYVSGCRTGIKDRLHIVATRVLDEKKTRRAATARLA